MKSHKCELQSEPDVLNSWYLFCAFLVELEVEQWLLILDINPKTKVVSVNNSVIYQCRLNSVWVLLLFVLAFSIIHDYFVAGKEEHFSDLFLLGRPAVKEMVVDVDHDNLTSPFEDDISIANSFGDPVTEFMETVPNSNHTSADDPKEMFLPGLIVHIVPDKRSLVAPIWKALTIMKMPQKFKAYVSDRETFKDIVVSPSMFLDHLPWRYLHAFFPFYNGIVICCHHVDWVYVYQMPQCSAKHIGCSRLWYMKRHIFWGTSVRSTKTWVIMSISCSVCFQDFWTKLRDNSC